MGLKTYQTVPIPTPIWLENALRPVITACLFAAPSAVELRPTGQAGGWCPSLAEAPDGRVAMSGRARFWRPQELALLYVHESAHRSLSGHGHDAAFFCLNLILQMRCDSAGLSDSVSFSNCSSFYDIQDLPEQLSSEPDQGLSRSIRWSVLTARQLVQDHPQASAEDLAGEVVKAFDQWLAELNDEPKKRAQQLQKVARQQEILTGMKEQIWTLKLIVFVLCLLLAATFVVLK